MQFAIGALIGILSIVTLGKGVYDRYFRDQLKPKTKAATPNSAAIDDPLSHTNWRIRAEAIQKLDPTAENIETLLPLLDDEDYDVRSIVRDKLAAIGKPAIAPLLDVLENGKLDARQMAAEALGQIGDNQAINGLLAAASDESKWVRLAVVAALGQFKSQTARKGLVKISQSDDDAQVRDAAQNILT
ncbi:MAG: HEAT repeat domain-containing protein [Anaerolineae bacterium]|nr:HEAT repeat domain-containing protein [Anaerolineae bacterium]MDQ7036604.1 HEAT repeat domain-containing protein [Anaerolineae bacterium]